MSRRMIQAVLIGVAASGSFLLIGCTSNDNPQPYGLTGQSAAVQDEQLERLRWTDDKGHYRPDLQMQGGASFR